MEPQNVETISICPKCGGRVVEILYGDPTIESWEAAKRGEIILGGCCIEVDKEGNLISPTWECVDCHAQF